MIPSDSLVTDALLSAAFAEDCEQYASFLATPGFHRFSPARVDEVSHGKLTFRRLHNPGREERRKKASDRQNKCVFCDSPRFFDMTSESGENYFLTWNAFPWWHSHALLVTDVHRTQELNARDTVVALQNLASLSGMTLMYNSANAGGTISGHQHFHLMAGGSPTIWKALDESLIGFGGRTVGSLEIGDLTGWPASAILIRAPGSNVVEAATILERITNHLREISVLYNVVCRYRTNCYDIVIVPRPFVEPKLDEALGGARFAGLEMSGCIQLGAAVDLDQIDGELIENSIRQCGIELSLDEIPYR